MFDEQQLRVQSLAGMAPQAVAQLVRQLLERIDHQACQIDCKDAEIRFKQARLEKITFELARLKRWKFGAKAEAMSAEQRRLFEETLAEDEASLSAQLEQLQAKAPASGQDGRNEPKRQPRRQALPGHLARIERCHEPEDTTCPMHGCGQPMERVGQDISEELDVVPAQFFVHRHIYGKWACRCYQILRQEPAQPRIIDGGIDSAALVAHTLIARFVGHLPYYRQESINARSWVHTPRSSLAQWSGRGGAALEPLYEAHP